jgi:ribosome maturation factor RimP
MNYSRFLVLFLVGLLIRPNLAGFEWLEAAPQPQSRRDVEAFGVGTEVKLVAGGKTWKGSIVAFNNENFDLMAGGSRTRRISYSAVTEFAVTKATYRDSESRFDQVRRGILALGPAERVKMKLVSGKSLKGQIQKVHQDSFTFLEDKKLEVAAIPYVEVLELRPQPPVSPKRPMSGFKKFAIGYGIIMLLIWSGSKKPGSLP